MKSILFLITLFLSLYSKAQLSGNYTIGGVSPSYSTINAAVNALISNGVNGPVTFNIRTGTYSEQVIIPQINGASQTNNIIFQSEGLDTSLVQWQFNSTSISQNYVCILDGADYISFNKLTVKRDNNTSYGCRVFILRNGACFNKIENCKLKGKTIYSYTDHEVIYSPNTIDSSNYFIQNSILNGYIGISLEGLDLNNYESNNQIIGNIIKSSNTSVFCRYVDQLKIVKNDNAGIIDINFFKGKLNILNNKVLNGYISVTNQNNILPDSLTIAGNMVKGTNNYAINIASCPNVYYFHNTIESAVTTTSTGVFRSFGSTIRFVNNITKNSTNGFAANFQSTNLISDYNIFWSSGNIIYYNGSTFSNINNWIASTLNDDNSYKVNPVFFSANDLHTYSCIEANSNGFNLNLGNDLDGDFRSNIPDIGSDEFNQPDNDAGVLKLTNIPVQICSESIEVKVNFKNYGEIPLTNVQLNWSVNGFVQTSVLWNGSLGSGDTSLAVTLGFYNFLANGTYNIVAWTSLPNGNVDELTSNDSYNNPTIYTMLSGSYTVGGISPDFTSFNACYSALILRGICSSVTFNVRPGTYNETLDINGNLINGTSFINTITFRSENGNSSSVELSYSASSVNWLFSSTYLEHTYFKHLTFTRIGSGSSDELFVFNDAFDLKFIDCIFNKTTRYNSTAIRFNSGSFIEIDSCRFNKMFEGIYATIDSNMVVKNCIFDNMVAKSLYIFQSSDSVFIDNNEFSNDIIGLPNNMISGASAINIATCFNIVEITNNKIRGRFYNGISLTSLIGNNSNRPKINNNFISVETENGNQCYALFVNGGNFLEIKHNNIRVFKNSYFTYFNSTAAFGIGSSSTSNLIFVNNILESDSTGFIFHFIGNWPSYFLEFDRNNVFITHPYFTQIINMPSPTWPNIWNANSKNYNPLYFSLNDLHVINPKLALGVAQWTNILTDIDAQARVHPTVGADEGEFIPINTGCIFSKVEIDCDTAAYFTKVFNYGLDTIYKFNIESSINGVSNPTLTWIGVLNPGDTTSWIQTGSFYQLSGNTYQISQHTILPNDSIDYISSNDSIIQFYSYSNLIDLNLGPDQTICLSDSILLSISNSNQFTNFNWSTGIDSSSTVAYDSGQYVILAEDIFHCLKSDTINVDYYSSQTITLTENDSFIVANSLNGSFQWYLDGNQLISETNDSLQINTFGYYYLLFTDSILCETNSDSIYIENSRDIGVSNLFFVANCDSTIVYANVTNYGLDTIFSFSINWNMNNTSMSTYNWNGVLNNGMTIDSLPLGTVFHNFSQIYQVDASSYLPNQMFDLLISNDSLSSYFEWIKPNLYLGNDTVSCSTFSVNLFPTDSSDFHNFLWSTNENTTNIYVTQSGEYYLQANDIFGCVHTDSIVVTIGSNLIPIVSFDGTQLNSSLSNNIQWYLNSQEILNANNQNLTPTSNGTYYITYFDSAGCTYTSNSIDLTNLGLTDLSNKIELYPNPSNDYFTLSSSQDFSNTIITIYSSSGEKLEVLHVDESNIFIHSIKSFSSGIYIVELQSAKFLYKFKLNKID